MVRLLAVAALTVAPLAMKAQRAPEPCGLVPNARQMECTNSLSCSDNIMWQKIHRVFYKNI